MTRFKDIYGYECIKEELMQLCDMIKNKEIYEKLGAKMPKGLLLNGEPGLGKSLMAKALINESGLKAYTLRRTKPKGDFVKEIKKVFTEAKKNSPSIVFMDDMDKFATDDRSMEEYVAVQACIDENAGSGIFVIATANDLSDIPESLLRAGRFDRRIDIERPDAEDSAAIITHFLSDKPISDNIADEDIIAMLSGSTCAELETIINEAAIYAAYDRSESIGRGHIVQSVLRHMYECPSSLKVRDADKLRRIAVHEAGHAVAAEMLVPESVGLITIRSSYGGSSSGFVHRCKKVNESQDILIALGGIAAVELIFGKADKGGEEDVSRVISVLIRDTTKTGRYGLSRMRVFQDWHDPDQSDNLTTLQEHSVQLLLEMKLSRTKELLASNREFLIALSDKLLESETLLLSDVRHIKKDICADICTGMYDIV